MTLHIHFSPIQKSKYFIYLIMISSFFSCNLNAFFGDLIESIEKAGDTISNSSSSESSDMAFFDVSGQATEQDIMSNPINHHYTWFELREEKHPDPTRWTERITKIYRFKAEYGGLYFIGNEPTGVYFKNSEYIDVPQTQYGWTKTSDGRDVKGLFRTSNWGQSLRLEQLSEKGNQHLEWLIIKDQKLKEEAKKLAEQEALEKKLREEMEAKEKARLEASLKQEKQDRLKMLRERFPAVKEVAQKMKSETLVIKSLYLGMPIMDAASAVTCADIGEPDFDEKNNIISVGNKIKVCDFTDSHNVLDSLLNRKFKNIEPWLSQKEKMKIAMGNVLPLYQSLNGVAPDNPDEKIDSIEIRETGLRELLKLGNDVGLDEFADIVSSVYSIKFDYFSVYDQLKGKTDLSDNELMFAIQLASPVNAIYLHVDHKKGFALRLADKPDLNFKLLKIPTPEELRTKEKIEAAAKEKALKKAAAAFE